MISTICLKTIVRNVSGKTKHFSFLGPRGVTLLDNQPYEFPGDLFSGVQGFDQAERQRNVDALLSVINLGLLKVVQTPNPVLLASGGQVKQLSLNSAGNALVIGEPCFGAAESDSG